jgi:hypothetical protein
LDKICTEVSLKIYSKRKFIYHFLENKKEINYRLSLFLWPFRPSRGPCALPAPSKKRLAACFSRARWCTPRLGLNVGLGRERGLAAAPSWADFGSIVASADLGLLEH